MSAKIGTAGKFGQILLFIINCIFIVLGIIALAIGAWAIATQSSFPFLSDNEVVGGAAILIIAGGVTIIIAAIGILGAIFKSRILLGIYALVVLAIVILEIVAGIVAFVYRNRVAGVVEMKVSDELISSYNVSSPNDANVIVDAFQKFFGCCGLSNASDWITYNKQAILDSNNQPPFCPTCDATAENCETYSFANNASTVSFNATNVGCASIDSDALLRLAIGAGVVGIIFGILEITGIVLASILCCCIHSALRKTSA